MKVTVRVPIDPVLGSVSAMLREVTCDMQWHTSVARYDSHLVGHSDCVEDA